MDLDPNPESDLVLEIENGNYRYFLGYFVSIYFLVGVQDLDSDLVK